MVTTTVNNLGGMRFIVERGCPYEKGVSFNLQNDKIVLGRATEHFSPDISFESLLISRRHCCITQQAGQFVLSDLGSKHGTLLNGKLILQDVPYPLVSGDLVALASGVALLRFLKYSEFETTIDLTNAQPVSPIQPASTIKRFFTVDQAKRTLHIEGREVCLSGKEWRLLEILYCNKNKVVTYDTLRLTIWSERNIFNGIPDVGFDEINALIYRVRRKLGVYANLLKTRRGQGCYLEVTD